VVGLESEGRVISPRAGVSRMSAVDRHMRLGHFPACGGEPAPGLIIVDGLGSFPRVRG